MAADNNDPRSYKGPRTPIVKKNPCGFCNTGDHDKCCHEIPWFEKLWICPCDCNKNWKPQDLGNEVTTKKKKVKEDEQERVNQRDEENPPNSSGGESVASSDVPTGESY